MGRFVGLLRNVNVASTGRLRMSDLVALATELGASRVQTYIQSGNLVFDLDDAVVAFAERLEAGILGRFGFTSPVVTRTAEEWATVLPSSPFPDDGALHVGFLRDRPDDGRVGALDPNRSPGDRFAVHGRELYLYFPNGVGRSKLTNAWFDRQLGTPSTWRNTRTIAALGALL